MGLWQLEKDIKDQYVVATAINLDGESDTLFIEPYNAIDEGCVALTPPMTLTEAEKLVEEMKRARNIEHR